MNAMRNTVWRALALAALIWAGSAANAAADWQDYVYAEDGFSIASPTKPEFTSSAVDSAAGKTYLHQYESDADADGHFRIYVTSQTLYQIMVVWSKDKPPADYGRYVNSFHFVAN
jgi:hypothetical protein